MSAEHLISELPRSLLSLIPVADSWDQFAGLAPSGASAVIMLLSDSSSSPSVVLIRRSSRLSSHKGQIAFPGGRREATDVGPAETALRELEEELGVPCDAVRILGALPETKSIDGSPVFPVVGVTSLTLEDLTPNEDEVSEVFLVSLSEFVAEKCHRFEFNLFGCWRNSTLYKTESVSVWGLTAEIIASANLQ